MELSKRRLALIGIMLILFGVGVGVAIQTLLSNYLDRDIDVEGVIILDDFIGPDSMVREQWTYYFFTMTCYEGIWNATLYAELYNAEVDWWITTDFSMSLNGQSPSFGVFHPEDGIRRYFDLGTIIAGISLNSSFGLMIGASMPTGTYHLRLYVCGTQNL